VRPRGNIEERSGGSLRVRVYAGKDILTGGDHYLKKTIPAGPDAWAQAELVRDQLVRQVEEGRHPRTNATLSQLIDVHLTNVDIERRTKQTLQGYARKHIHALPVGGRTIAEVDAQALETFYAELRRCRDHCDGRPTVRHFTAVEHRCGSRCKRHECQPLGKWTVRKIHFLISAAYQRAIRWKWIDTNPTRQAEVPAPPPPDPNPLRIPLTTLLTLLRQRTTHYAAQPYQQLAAAYRAEGHARDARAVLIAQQQALRARGQLGGLLTTMWHRISGLTIGYGYRPGRALAGLLLTVLAASGVVFIAAATGHTSHTKDRPPGACTLIEHVGLAADLAVPLIKTGGQQRCEFTPTRPGSDWFIATGWLLQFLGWAFATLFVAGFTGLVRKQ
jgi:hypothetical protein